MTQYGLAGEVREAVILTVGTPGDMPADVTNARVVADQLRAAAELIESDYHDFDGNVTASYANHTLTVNLQRTHA